MNTPEVTPLACPFCGGAAHTCYIRDGRLVRCIKCGASGPGEFHGPADGASADDRAIAAWNRRAALALPQAALSAQPVHQNHLPDLRYVRMVLEKWHNARATDDEIAAAMTGMRYIIKRTEESARPVSPAPTKQTLTDDEIGEISSRYATGRAQGDVDFARAILSASSAPTQPTENDGWRTSPDGLTRTLIAPNAAAAMVPSKCVTLGIPWASAAHPGAMQQWREEAERLAETFAMRFAARTGGADIPHAHVEEARAALLAHLSAHPKE